MLETRVENSESHVGNLEMHVENQESHVETRKLHEENIGSEILSLSENPSYEPIMMRSEDVYINGRVIGVLKK